MTSFVILQLEKYSTTILSAMMAGMDDKDDLEDEITLESMSGLAKILAKLDENNVRQILINICLRIRPCFEKVGPKIKQCHSNGLIWFPYYFFLGGAGWVYFERFVGITFGELEIETLSKPQRRRQRGRGKAKDLMGRTIAQIAQYVRFETVHFLAVLCKEQREITKISVV